MAAKKAGRRTARRRRKNRIRRGMFLFSFLIVAAAMAVTMPYMGILPALAEESTQLLTPLSADDAADSDLPIIAIDPGHGGTDPGCEGSGVVEYQMTWRTANALSALLKADGRFAPMLTLTEEESQNSDSPRVEPAERARRANEAGAVLFFSIHGNSDASGTASGFECYPIPPGHSSHDASLSLARRGRRALHLL